MDRMDAMHKFFMVARKWQLCDPRIIDLDNLRSPSNPRNPQVCIAYHTFFNITANALSLQILDLGCGTGIWALDVAKSVDHPGQVTRLLTLTLLCRKFWDPQAKVFIDGHIQAVDKCLDMQPEK